MCTPCCRVPSGPREEPIPTLAGPLHHAGVWENPDVLWLLPLQSPGTFIHFCLAWGHKASPHLQAVDSILFQEDKSHLRPSAGFGT